MIFGIREGEMGSARHGFMILSKFGTLDLKWTWDLRSGILGSIPPYYAASTKPFVDSFESLIESRGGQFMVAMRRGKA